MRQQGVSASGSHTAVAAHYLFGHQSPESGLDLMRSARGCGGEHLTAALALPSTDFNHGILIS
jgi:hypothetical protein